jgi:hypothetical protein
MGELKQCRAKECAFHRLMTIGEACRAMTGEALRTTLSWAIEQVTDQLRTVRRSQCRPHQRVCAARQHRRREAERGRAGIAEGLDLAAKHIGQGLERSFDVPAIMPSNSAVGWPGSG